MYVAILVYQAFVQIADSTKLPVLNALRAMSPLNAVVTGCVVYVRPLTVPRTWNLATRVESFIVNPTTPSLYALLVTRMAANATSRIVENAPRPIATLQHSTVVCVALTSHFSVLITPKILYVQREGAINPLLYLL